MWSKLILIAVAGTAGTLSRYWVSGLTYQVMGSKFAYGTLAVNFIGCFLFGLVWTLSEERMAISTLTRTVYTRGFHGGVYDVLHVRIRDDELRQGQPVSACFH